MIPVKAIRDHLEIPHKFDDQYLECTRGDAISMIESDLEIVIARRQEILNLNNFCNGIMGLLRPVASIDRISYIDSMGVSVDVPADNYVLTGDKITGFSGKSISPVYLFPCVELEYNAAWPVDIAHRRNAVTVEYTAGFTQGELPGGLVRAILVLIGSLFRNRENTAAVKLHEIPAYTMAVQPFKKIML